MTATRTTRRGLFEGFVRRAARVVADERSRPVDALGPPAAAVSAPPRVDPEPPPPWASRRARPVVIAAGQLARVLPFACIGGPPSFCSACIEHCPVPGALEPTDRAPRVNADACDGCGACARVCPAPSPAIVILPRLPTGAPPR